MSTIPQHIAIIMDGNGRWAQKRHMPRTVGHAKGAAGVRDLVEFCARKGVKYLTLFAFSTVLPVTVTLPPLLLVTLIFKVGFDSAQIINRFISDLAAEVPLPMATPLMSAT